MGPTERALARQRLLDTGLYLLVACGAFGLYLQTVAPTLGGTNNSAEFQHAAYALQIAHPPGYPLYLLLGHLWVHALPVGDPAYRLNLFSAPLMALAAGNAYLAGRLLSGSRPAALVGAAMFATALPVWRQGSVAEPDALNAALVSLAFLTFLAWIAGRAPLVAPALALGLALANHRTSAFYILPLALAAVSTLRKCPEPPRRVVAAAALGLVPLLLYAYIPLRAATSPWYANSLDGFLTMVTARDVGHWLGTSARTPPERVASLAGDLLGPFLGGVGGALAAFGLAVWCARASVDRSVGARPVAEPPMGCRPLPVRSRTTAAMWLGSFLLVVAFAALYEITDIDRYLIVPLWLAFTGASVGLAALLRLAAQRRAGRLAAGALLALAALQPVAAVRGNWAAADSSHHLSERRLWDENLRAAIAPDALILGDWVGINDIRYLQTVEGRRTDLRTAEPPGDAKALDTLLAARQAAGRPTYLAVLPLDRALGVPVRPVGTLWEVLPAPVDLPVQVPVAARFGNGASLVGLWQNQRRLESWETLEVRLAWTSAAPDPFMPAIDVVDGAGRGVDLWKTTNPPAPFAAEDRTQLSQHGILIPDWLPPGRYSLYASLRDGRGARVPAFDTAGRPLGEGLIVTSFVRPPAEPEPLPDTQPGITFGQVLRLAGWQIEGEVAAGRPLRVRATWEALRPPAEDLKFSVQVLDGDGRLVAQADQEPHGGGFPTSVWRAGERVRDTVDVSLPAGTVAGAYRVILAVYSPAGGMRLLTPTGDHAVLGTVSLRGAE